jgi:ergothioneine biosynthesis protein EgtB
MLMDIKHVFSRNPLAPAYQEPAPQRSAAPAPPMQWTAVDGGLVETGVDVGESFCFDNETPRHRVWLEPFRIASRPVTCSEWIEFIDDGGYRTPSLWLSDGWATVERERWDAPLYWSDSGDERQVFTLRGLRSVDPAEPVVHVSYYEADAFARWAGARLPTEAVLAAQRLHPAPAHSGGGLQQTFGDVWEWTASAYLPYPGFEPCAGAVGEYNGKFMSGQMVLKGGCCVTPDDHVRATYRNFFYPSQRWMFSGVRLAARA